MCSTLQELLVWTLQPLALASWTHFGKATKNSVQLVDERRGYPSKDYWWLLYGFGTFVNLPDPGSIMGWGRRLLIVLLLRWSPKMLKRSWTLCSRLWASPMPSWNQLSKVKKIALCLAVPHPDRTNFSNLFQRVSAELLRGDKFDKKSQLLIHFFFAKSCQSFRQHASSPFLLGHQWNPKDGHAWLHAFLPLCDPGLFCCARHSAGPSPMWISFWAVASILFSRLWAKRYASILIVWSIADFQWCSRQISQRRCIVMPFICALDCLQIPCESIGIDFFRGTSIWNPASWQLLECSWWLRP